LVLAGVATPLVFSVHSVVSMDFATSIIPGWHTTIFPPYFVSGAVFSGFAMVQTLLLVMRKVMHLEAYITKKHVEYMNIVIIVTGSIVGVAYITELFISWYSGVEYESYAFINRATGPYWWATGHDDCNVISPQLFWFKKLRTQPGVHLLHEHHREHRYVVRALRDHRDQPASRLPAEQLEHVPPDMGRCGHLPRHHRYLLHPVPALRPLLPCVALNEVKSILKTSGESYKKEAAQHHHH
jgi:hypothetical protein